MYGAIIGDIAGSTFERKPTKKKDFELFRWRSRVTDDSVMTVAIAEALLDADGDVTREAGDDSGEKADGDDDQLRVAFAQSMKKWGRKYPGAGYGSRFFTWLKLDDMEAYNSFGNGSAMRVSPCGWMADNLDEVRRLARISSITTHDHPEGIKGAESVAAAIFMARTGRSKAEIKEYIEKEFGYDLDRTCDEIRPGYAFDVTCQGSVPESIICFLDGEDYEDTIRNAVSLGGDSDTQAAIAGSIAEAFYGIPNQLIEKAKEFIPADIQEVVDRFYQRIHCYNEIAR